jgi:tetratricopeptide (TPR) repeat protein
LPYFIYFYLKKMLHIILIITGLIFSALAHGAVETWAVSVLNAWAVLLACVWGLSMLHSGKLILRRTAVDLPLLAGLGFCGLSVFFSVYPYASLFRFFHFLSVAAVFYVAVNALDFRDKILGLVTGIVIFGSLYAAAGLFWMQGSILGFEVLSKASSQISFTFANANHFGGYVEMLVWLCVGLALARKGIMRALYLILGISMAAAIPLTLSRGAFMGLVSGLLFFLTALGWKRRKRTLFIFLINFFCLSALVAGWVGLDPFLEKIQTLKTAPVTETVRIRTWKDSLDIIRAYPWTGTGPGTYADIYPQYQSQPMPMYSMTHAHNDFLEMTAESGIPAALCALTALFILFISVLKSLGPVPYSRFRSIGTGALAGCVSILVHGMADFNFQIPSNLLLFALCAAIALLSGGLFEQERHWINRGVSPKQSMGISALVIIMGLICISIALSPAVGDLYFKKARDHQRAGSFDSARSAMNLAMAAAPGNAQYLALMGDLSLSLSTQASDNLKIMGWMETALGYYTDAVKACPKNGYYHSKKAYCLLRMGRHPAAEASFKEAAALAPQNDTAHFDLANYYLEQRNFSAAYPHYREFIRMSQNLPLAIDDLWNILADYDTVKPAIPEIPEIRKAFARYLFSKGRYEDSLTELARAFSLEPSEENALVHLEQSIRLKKWDMAIDIGEEYLKHFGGNRLKRKMAEVYGMTGHDEKSIEIYEGLWAENPADVSVITALSAVLQKAGRTGEAAGVLEKGIRHLPHEARLYILLADGYKKNGRQDDALNLLKTGIEQNPGHPQIQSALISSLREQGDVEAVFETLKHLIRLRPDDPALWHQLGEEYRRQDLLHQAVVQWKRCLEISHYPPCTQGIQDVYKKLGIHEKTRD